MLSHKILISTLLALLLITPSVSANASRHNVYHVKEYPLVTNISNHTYSHHGVKAALKRTKSNRPRLSQEHLADLKINILQCPHLFHLTHYQAMYIFTHNQSHTQMVNYMSNVSHRSKSSIELSIHHFINKLMALPMGKDVVAKQLR